MTFGERLKEARLGRKITQEELAANVDPPVTRETVSQWENGDTTPRPHRWPSIAAALGIDVSWLSLGEPVVPLNPDNPRAVPEISDKSTDARIIEIDVYGGLGGGGEAPLINVSDGNGGVIAADGARAEWVFPAYYFDSELNIAAEHSRLFEVKGDSMEPTLKTGDRVMVNLQDKTPSPAGIFAVWDGLGVVVKRLDHIPNSDPPTLKVKSENPEYDDYERTLDEVNIIGRVVWAATKL